MSKAQPRRLDQGNNDDQAAEDEWNFGFDVEDYSVKYTGCSAIKTYSDEEAQDGLTVLESKRFVVFRLCPSDSCNQYSSEGCSSDFGEYVLEMGDYLEAMTMYQEEKVQNFCAYCEWCAENEWNDDAAAAQGDDAAAQDGDDAAAADGDDAQRRLEDAAAGDDAAAAEEEQGDDAAAAEEEAAEEEACSMCSNYNQVCNENQNQNNGDDGQGQEQMEMDQFFECVQVQNENNGYAYYLGPHCGSDGFTISIGLYSDETCSTYIGQEKSVYDATGLDLSELDMTIYTPKECQSCMENVSNVSSHVCVFLFG